MKKKSKKLFIGVSVLVGILLLFILYLSWPLLTGETIMLATRPIDPFDPLRGQYIIINYEISSLPAEEGIEQGDAVYVLLAPDAEGIWRLQRVETERPAAGVFIRGNVERLSGEQMNIRYGIEQFFFERNAQMPTTDITVEAKVSPDGQARIVRLWRQGKPVEITYKKPTVTS